MAATAAIACSQCRTANPLFSRYCRICSCPLQASEWSSRAGGPKEHLPAAFPPGEAELKLAWHLPPGPEPVRAVLSSCGACVVVASSGYTRVLSHEGNVLAEWRPPPGDSLVAHPVTIQGLLVLPLANSGLQCVDLIYASGRKVFAASRSCALPLGGACAGHLGVSDAGQFACVSRSSPEHRVLLGETDGLKARWSFSQLLPGAGESEVFGCCFSGKRLWVCGASGTVWAVCCESGSVLGQWKLPRNLLPETLQAKGEHVLVCGTSQELFQWRAQESQWASLWLPDAGPIFALGTEPTTALVVAGNQLTWLSLETRATHRVILPDKVVAPPLLGLGGAMVLSYTGSLYLWRSNSRGPRLHATVRLQSRLDGCVLPPVLVHNHIVLTGHHGEVAAVRYSAGGDEALVSGADLRDQLDGGTVAEQTVADAPGVPLA
jgi:hypothetical protein